MTKTATILILALIPLTGIVGSCSSGGTTAPSNPNNPDELTLSYCRVVLVNNLMHAQWAANRPTTGDFRFGQGAYTQMISELTAADSHDVALTSLSFSSSYIYRLTVRDAQSNTAECTGDFTTPAKATPEPIISGLQIHSITESGALIEWQTDEPATTILYYGIGSAEDSVVESQLTMDHDVTLISLTPLSDYALRPEAIDSDGLRGIGVDTTFQTAALLMLSTPPLTIGLGDTASLPITIEQAHDLAAMQYELIFPEHHLELVDLREGPFYTENSGFVFFRDLRNGLGEVVNHLVWDIQYSGDDRVGTEADGDGVVAYVVLRGIEPGTEHPVFSADSTFGLDMFEQVRLCSLRTGIITVLP